MIFFCDHFALLACTLFSAIYPMTTVLGVLALSAAGKLIVSMLIKSGIDEVRLFVGMKR